MLDFSNNLPPCFIHFTRYADHCTDSEVFVRRETHVVQVYHCSQTGIQSEPVHHNVYNLALDFPRIKLMRTLPKASLSLIIRIFQPCNLLTILRSIFSQSFQLDFLGPRRSQAQQQCIPTFFASLPPIHSLLARPGQSRSRLVGCSSSSRTAQRESGAGWVTRAGGDVHSIPVTRTPHIAS